MDKLKMARFINQHYQNVKDVDHVNSKAAWDQTNAILSAGAIQSAKAYCGVNANVGLHESGVIMYTPNCKKPVAIAVYVNGLDHYVVELWQFPKRGGCEGEALRRQECFADGLREAFEQMYDWYIQEHQEGFIVFD
jgi:hypothetical protein